MKEARIENDVETYLKKQAEKNGYLCYKFVSPGHNGVPDRLIIGHGRTFFVETKAPNGTPRKLQQKVIEKMRNNGADVYIINTKAKVDELFEKTLIESKNNIST